MPVIQRPSLACFPLRLALVLGALIVSFLWGSLGRAAESCGHVFVSSADGKLRSPAQILHEIDPHLHSSSFVTSAVERWKRKTGSTVQKPAEKIDQWFHYLDLSVRKAKMNPQIEEVLRQQIYDLFLIKKENFPESHFEREVRLQRERGLGTENLEYVRRVRMVEHVIQDQKKSLDDWINYLFLGDMAMYPMWLKYWMLKGIKDLSKYDATTGKFGHREKDTTTPFPELNREALAYVVDAVVKKLNKRSLEEIADPDFVKLLDRMNFGAVYGRALHNLGIFKHGDFLTNEGKWVFYGRYSDPLVLVGDLRGKNTGWCTVGEMTADLQLKRGDFHVYYSLDDNGKPTIPRIAIRMEGINIAEVRGVAKGQELDAQIVSSGIASARVATFSEKGKAFEKKYNDMKRMTEIDDKVHSNQELSVSDLRFLYEVDDHILGFGTKKDPRILEIIRTRDVKKDLLLVFDGVLKEDEISTTTQEALSGKSKFHWGDIGLAQYTAKSGIVLPKVIVGDLAIYQFKSEHELILPEVVRGNLTLRFLQHSNSLNLPKHTGTLVRE